MFAKSSYLCYFLYLRSLKNGDVLVFDRMSQVLPIAIRGSRCLPLDPSSANLSANDFVTRASQLVAKKNGWLQPSFAAVPVAA